MDALPHGAESEFRDDPVAVGIECHVQRGRIGMVASEHPLHLGRLSPQLLLFGIAKPDATLCQLDVHGFGFSLFRGFPGAADRLAPRSILSNQGRPAHPAGER